MRKIWCSFEHGTDRLVDRLCRGQVAADRLFQYDPRLRRDQAVTREIAADLAEQVGRGRQIEHTDLLRPVAQQRRQLVPAALGGRFERDILQALDEALPDLPR